MRKFLKLGICLVVGASFLLTSCGETAITQAEATTKFKAMDAKKAFDELNGLEVTATIEAKGETVEETGKAEVKFQVDFTETSVYLYMEVSMTQGGKTEEMKGLMYIDGTTAYSGESVNGEVNEATITVEQVKTQFTEAKDSTIYTMANNEELSAMVFGAAETTFDYFELSDGGLKVSGESSATVGGDGVVQKINIEYTNTGLLRLVDAEINTTANGVTTVMIMNYEIDYNANFTKLTSLK